ncbi:hypothetical protein EW146_g870 [Bondarzewia mesenterica]|uniref:Exonuclease V, mitochondrial n=1 Tax=Bondarzewia mesenterica TaxID=1095465 RepID=A0A4S4M5H6_9AGAM|nr:hypothetical protein EW146_g870 [Bondarzewia mesenterica]
MHPSNSGGGGGSGDDDEYGAYDLSEFTVSDFAHIDATCTSSARFFGGPRIAVQLERHADAESRLVVKGTRRMSKEQGKVPWEQRSPYERYRFRGFLSVTDLVSPAWCELQFDYGLRQGRWRNLADRKPSFVSAEGKTIVVEQKVAAVMDKVKKRGTAVHKKLEKEVRPVEVKVEAATEEERWALRIINLIESMETMMERGFCREISVIGMVNDEIVMGVIDEIRRESTVLPQAIDRKRVSRSIHDTPKKTKKRRPLSPTAEHIVNSSIPSPPPTLRLASPPRPSTPPKPTHSLLYISDTKTRSMKSLPSDEDALSARLQLMLYHRLLSALLHPDFSFAPIWHRLGLDVTRPLSDTFIEQAGLLESPMRCLYDLEGAWRSVAEAISVDGVSSTLEIMYRTRPPRKKKDKGKGKGKGKEGGETDEDSSDDAKAHGEKNLAKAIEESLKSLAGEQGVGIEASGAGPSNVGDCQPKTDDGDRARAVIDALTHPEKTGEGMLGEDPELAWLAQQKLLEAKPGIKQALIAEDALRNMRALAGDAAPPPPSDLGETESRIIGTKMFEMDENFLSRYLTDVLQYWHGGRPPKGVEVVHSVRCLSCEYMEGCEWREKKALEVFDRLAAKKGQAQVG